MGLKLWMRANVAPFICHFLSSHLQMRLFVVVDAIASIVHLHCHRPKLSFDALKAIWYLIAWATVSCAYAVIVTHKLQVPAESFWNLSHIHEVLFSALAWISPSRIVLHVCLMYKWLELINIVLHMHFWCTIAYTYQFIYGKVSEQVITTTPT